MKGKISLSLALVLALASSPAWAESQGQQILQLQQQVAVLQGEVQSLIAVQKASRGSQAALGNLLTRSQQMEQEIRDLRGQLESKTHALELAQQSSNAKISALSATVASLTAPTASTASTTTASVLSANSTTPAQAIAAEASSNTGSAIAGLGQAEYQRAFSLLREGKYGTAVTAFTAFIQKYPQSSLVVDAYYWLGQAQYVLGKNSDAIHSLETVANQYGQSSKAPDALLRLGQIYQALGQPAKARLVLGQLIRKYPSTPAAQKAQAQLQASGGR
ncbi:MAG: tol-pal system protein YbgF [Acidithiobacillus sp.]|nr:tol-pal system protein YbgF [Acidithiobacillus sp.]